MSERQPFSLQVSALFEAENADSLPQSDLDPYTFSVLTVCTGNICRSPLAEALVARDLCSVADGLGLSDGFAAASSSGLGAVVGAGVDPAVLALGEEYGLHLSAHRARQFVPAHAESTHLILTATRAQREEVASLAPSATARCFTLLEFSRLLDRLEASDALAPPASPLRRPTRVSRRLQRIVADAHAARQFATGDDDIEDPYLKSAEVHGRVAAQIRATCDRIGEGLRAGTMQGGLP